jgi:hypothetical protein
MVVEMGSRPDRLPGADPAPGVTRFDMLCQPRIVETVLDLMGRWAEDRALPENVRKRLDYLVGAAVEHGMRFEPRALAVSVRWTGLEQIRIDLRWFGCNNAARSHSRGHDLAATASTLDALAVEWGVGRLGDVSVQWIVANTA